MRILYAAGDSPYNRHVRDALISNGHEVQFIDMYSDFAMPSPLRNSRLLWKASRRIGFLRQRSKKALARKILDAADRFAPEILLSIKGSYIKPGLLRFVQSRGISTVCWFPENAANEPYATWVRTVGPLWDHFLSFDSAILGQMPSDERAKIGVLPFGASPEGFDPGELTEGDRRKYSCDVAFIGAPYPDRVALLERVRDRNLKIWGWMGWKNTPMAQYWHGPLDARESGKVYRLAKICVGTNVAPLTNGANCRTYEIAAAGGFQLSDEPADLHKSFSIGTELDVFHSPGEFEEKVRYWLAHDEERRRVAQAGHERLLRDHTLRKRMKQLIAMVT